MNRIKVIILISFCTFLGFLDPVADKNRVGNKLYGQEKYDEALVKYREAQLKKPQSTELYFNIGNAFYKKQQYEKAIKEYQNALKNKETLFRAKTYYNIGNSQYRDGKLVNAIVSYKKSLQINPDDLEAKYNLEFVLKKLKQLSQKHPAKSEQQKQKKSKGSEGENGKNKEKQTQQAKQEDKNKMSKEDAGRILQALEEEEKEIQKRKQVQISGDKQIEKDW
ncbi:MAG: tetratricopeptide repeat protein [bacterium]